MEIISLIGFPLVTILFIGLFYNAVKVAIFKTTWTSERKQKISTRLVIGLLLWALLISGISMSGFTSRFDLFPFNVMPLVALPLLIILSLLFTKGMKDILQQLSLKTLTQLQVFRVFVEVILWMLFLQNLLPVQMTFEGLNWDVISGITALLATYFFINSKPAMVIWNILGLLLLINIVGIAILSMPTPLRIFHNEPANIIVTQFPYAFLPAFLVTLAYTLHFMSLRKLLMKS